MLPLSPSVKQSVEVKGPAYIHWASQQASGDSSPDRNKETEIKRAHIELRETWGETWTQVFLWIMNL